ncbi:putative phosphoglycerate mutase pmu1 [Coniothyrium glycines]
MPSTHSTLGPKFCGTNIRTSFVFATILAILLLYYMMGEPPRIPVPASPPRDFHFTYSVQKGYFMQSEQETDDKSFDFRKHNFGLINRSYPSDTDTGSTLWSRFEAHVRNLQSQAAPHESYKVLFLGRHGQGWHNVAESKYGTKAWDCYYAALDGADGIVWADAHLTPTGQQQALDVHALWAAQLALGVPAPETYYVSPLTRTIQTADLTFRALDLPAGKQYKPVIKELLREALGVHTCDRRSTKSRIAHSFPHVTFEPGFSDADPLWDKDYREPRAARRYRLLQLLDDVFASDEKVFLSMTSHSGAIGSILEGLGHRDFALETGGVIPVVVKSERVEGKRAVPPKEPSDAPPLCDAPPR